MSSFAQLSSSPGALTLPLHPKQWLAYETPATKARGSRSKIRVRDKARATIT
jgi:hypothetical protein